MIVASSRARRDVTSITESYVPVRGSQPVQSRDTISSATL